MGILMRKYEMKNVQKEKKIKQEVKLYLKVDPQMKEESESVSFAPAVCFEQPLSPV